MAPADFSAVFNRNPARAGGRYFTLLAIPNHCSRPRLGLAIAKKRIKKATARNRIKRLARETFRLKQHQLPAIDIVVMAKSGADQATNQALTKELAWAFRKLTSRFAASPSA